MVWKRLTNKNQNQSALAFGVGVGVSVAAAATIGYILTKTNSSSYKLGLDSVRWKECVDEEGRLVDFVDILQEVGEKGVDASTRRDVWPYLLGLYSPKSSTLEREAQLEVLETSYLALVQQAEELYSLLEGTLAEADPSDSNPPNIPPHLAQFAEAHRIIVMDAVRTNFKLHEKVSPQSSTIRTFISTLPLDKALPNSWNAAQWWKGLWVSTTARQMLDTCSHFSIDQKRQAARLISLLSAYALHDPEIGYCQGMSDLAVPFILLFQNDAEAFWCFKHLMQRTRRNFAVDESGIYTQLQQLTSIIEQKDAPLFHRLRQIGAADCHFVYRMIVVLMKRDLPIDQVLQFWEMLWADDMLITLGKHHHFRANAQTSTDGSAQATHPSIQEPAKEDLDLFIYFIAAVVLAQRRKILDDCHDNDDVLKLFNKANVDVWECLRKARSLRQHLVSATNGSLTQQPHHFVPPVTPQPHHHHRHPSRDLLMDDSIPTLGKSSECL